MSKKDLPRFMELMGAGGRSPEELAKRLDAVVHTLMSLSQEVETLRLLLEERGGVDRAAYARVRELVMLGDLGGPGPEPWNKYSHYKHTLDPEAFMRLVLELDDAAIARWRRVQQQNLT
jgi:hypothetical protein